MTRKFLILTIIGALFQFGCSNTLAIPNKEAILRAENKAGSIYDYPPHFYAAYEKEPSYELPPSLKNYFEQEVAN